MRLTFVIASRILLVIISAVVLVTFLNYSRFQTLLGDVEAERFAMHTEQIRQLAERGLDLGLTVDQLGNVEDAIDRLQAEVEGVRAVQLVDPLATIAYSAQRAEGGGAMAAGVGETIPVAWAEVLSADQRGVITDETDDAYVVVQPIINAFGQPAGAIVILYDRDLQATALQSSLWSIAIAGGWAALLAGLACLVTIYLSLRPLSRSFDRMTGAAQDFLSDPITGGQDFEPRNALENDYRQFLDAARAAAINGPDQGGSPGPLPATPGTGATSGTAGGRV